MRLDEWRSLICCALYCANERVWPFCKERNQNDSLPPHLGRHILDIYSFHIHQLKTKNWFTIQPLNREASCPWISARHVVMWFWCFLATKRDLYQYTTYTTCISVASYTSPRWQKPCWGPSHGITYPDNGDQPTEYLVLEKQKEEAAFELTLKKQKSDLGQNNWNYSEDWCVLKCHK